MGRTKQTARTSTGGKAPRKQLAAKTGKQTSTVIMKGKGGKGLTSPSPSKFTKIPTKLSFIPSSTFPSATIPHTIPAPLPTLSRNVTSHVSNVRAHMATKTAEKLPTPSHWTDMEGENNIMVNIDQNVEGFMKMEWENVQMKFEKTFTHATIISIHRLQNVFFWENYYLRKRKLEYDYGKGCSNELSLFHGTTPDSLEVITEQNLDPRLAGGRTGTVLGKGIYFAKDASYSDSYAQPDDEGHKFMFLCKVLAGKTCQGKSDYTRPPQQFAGGPLFDSCVDNEKNPRIYCVYHDSQYYPEYLIEYI